MVIGGVWCRVVWCGVVWCGVVLCGVVWRGVVWYGVVWCGVVWCGVVRCGVVRCGVVWCGVVWGGVGWCVLNIQTGPSNTDMCRQLPEFLVPNVPNTHPSTPKLDTVACHVSLRSHADY